MRFQTHKTQNFGPKEISALSTIPTWFSPMIIHTGTLDAQASQTKTNTKDMKSPGSY